MKERLVAAWRKLTKPWFGTRSTISKAGRCPDEEDEDEGASFDEAEVDAEAEAEDEDGAAAVAVVAAASAADEWTCATLATTTAAWGSTGGGSCGRSALLL